MLVIVDLVISFKKMLEASGPGCFRAVPLSEAWCKVCGGRHRQVPGHGAWSGTDFRAKSRVKQPGDEEERKRTPALNDL